MCSAPRFYQVDDAVCQHSRRGGRGDERMVWVAARWYPKSFQGTILSLLNIRAQYSSCYYSLDSSQSRLHKLSPSLLLRQATSIYLPDLRNHACTRLRKLATLRRVISHSSSLRIQTTQESCTILGCGSDNDHLILYYKAEGSANIVLNLS